MEDNFNKQRSSTNNTPKSSDIYREETAAEFAAPVDFERDTTRKEQGTETAGKGFGIAALVLSILSLFWSPVLFGAAGIVLGIVARNRGARTMGNWAIGLGILSIVISLFLAPFF